MLGFPANVSAAQRPLHNQRTLHGQSSPISTHCEQTPQWGNAIKLIFLWIIGQLVHPLPHVTKIHIRGFKKLSNWLLKQFSLNIFFKAESCVTVQQETITDSNTASFYICWLKQSCFSKHSGWSIFNNTVQRAMVAVLTVRAVDERKGHNDFMGCARLGKCCFRWAKLASSHLKTESEVFFAGAVLMVWIFERLHVWY